MPALTGCPVDEVQMMVLQCCCHPSALPSRLSQPAGTLPHCSLRLATGLQSVKGPQADPPRLTLAPSRVAPTRAYTIPKNPNAHAQVQEAVC